jgi:O-antigen/teichoic acid export membrane protein
MADSLKQKTLSGLVWNFLETFALQGFGFVQGIILARLLMPSDYGLIAMTAVFFTISYALADTGFTSALIRKKERKEIDYSTVFVANIVITFILCVILCLCASFIAKFYKEPLLEKIVCINALLMFLTSFLSILSNRLTIQLQFKDKSIVNVIAAVVTGCISMGMAFWGYGVWSLIFPNFVSFLIRLVMYWRYLRWFPQWAFSWSIYKEYFSYGSKMLLTTLIGAVYNNIYPIFIGRYYSSMRLGYYNKAQSYAALPSSIVGTAISKVTFPVLAKIQDDDDVLRMIYRKMIRVSAFVVFPTATLIAVLARPLVLVLLTEKWEQSIIYLQILCFAAMWDPIHSLNLNLLMIKGRSELFLRLEIIKKIIGIGLLCVTIPMGLVVMCYGQVVAAILFLVINTYYTGKFINVGFFRQIRDLVPTILSTLAMGGFVWLVLWPIPSFYVQIVVGSIIGICSYWGVAKITKSEDYDSFLDLVKRGVPEKYWEKMFFWKKARIS